MATSYENSGVRMRSVMLAGLAAFCLALIVFEWYQVTGKHYGMFYGVFADPPNFGFSIGGPNYYQSINLWYFTIGICLMVYLIGMLLGRSLPAVIFRIVSLCVSTFPFMNMLMYKLGVLNLSSRYEWLETSIYLDGAGLLLIATMVGIEIISYISRKTDDIPLARLV